MYVVTEEFEGLTYHEFVTGKRPSALSEAHSLEELLKQVRFNLERMDTMTLGRSVSNDTITIYFFKTSYSGLSSELALEMQMYFESDTDRMDAEKQIDLLIDSMKGKELIVVVPR